MNTKNYIVLSKLKALKKHKSITNVIIAKRLGISKAFYCQIENGKRRLFYDTSIQIADIFNTTPDKLFYKDFSIDLEK